EVIGKQLWELGFIEDKELSRKAFAALKTEGYIRYEDIPLRTKSGDVINVEFVSNTYVVDSTKIIQCNIRDITERKKVENSLLVMNNKLNILSSITRHDILNQVTIVLGYLELQKHAISERGKRELQAKTERAVLEIQRQIEFTRDYQQMGTSKPQWQNLSEVILNLPVAKEIKNLQLADCLKGTKIHADPMLGKVFHNLITNSLKHGGGVSQVKIDCIDQLDAMLIVYEDDGKGIEADQKESIFEKGFGNGSGLGLFLSREILSITGITIKENGTPGKGARFELRVPLGVYQIFR
ncbi:MAG: PAS domain-containing sensor histidine kinase, partial [Methanomassiliicoccales archaeon]|nr:PAS domain-containing sensor histidine kinase [Methanomassiliicoccales archaeon]